MFKWSDTQNLSARPRAHELADFAELECWQNRRISRTDLIDLLSLGAVNEGSDAGPGKGTALEAIVLDAFGNLGHRAGACREGYPFQLDLQGYALSFNQLALNHRYVVYQYLLLATRLDMRSNRMHAGLDGALLFEELAAEAAREYLGARAESLVFGTAAEEGNFQAKVNELCRLIKEGGGFVERDATPSRPRDGKLDVVAWKHFTDGLAGKLIVFGQCKTGTNYSDTLTQLNPTAFYQKWFRDALVVTPVRTFFIAEALPSDQRYNASSDAGILFDRCRIVDFCDNVDKDVLSKVTAWTIAAAKANGLPEPLGEA